MLSPYRVLDLSDERGIFCSFVLGELGADVVCVEPPGGSRARLTAWVVGVLVGPDRGPDLLAEIGGEALAQAVGIVRIKNIRIGKGWPDEVFGNPVVSFRSSCLLEDH